LPSCPRIIEEAAWGHVYRLDTRSAALEAAAELNPKFDASNAVCVEVSPSVSLRANATEIRVDATFWRICTLFHTEWYPMLDSTSISFALHAQDATTVDRASALNNLPRDPEWQTFVHDGTDAIAPELQKQISLLIASWFELSAEDEEGIETFARQSMQSVEDKTFFCSHIVRHSSAASSQAIECGRSSKSHRRRT
jgi:hypothetical protein